MVTKMKPTLANLEREEKGVVKAFNNGRQIAGSLREHVFNIKSNELWRAADCKSFKEYCEQGRITIGTDKEPEQIKLGYRQLSRLAVNGELENQIPKGHVCLFSDKSLEALSKLRVEIKDDNGQVVKKTHDLDLKRIKAVINTVLNERAKAITNGTGNGQITAKLIKTTVEKKYGFKPPKSMAKILEGELKRINRLLTSMESAIELNEFLFSDAEEESPGCAKRLATGYSKIASFLRKV
jgi:hypothetical protein